jgi:hypothetical protein
MILIVKPNHSFEANCVEQRLFGPRDRAKIGPPCSRESCEEPRKYSLGDDDEHNTADYSYDPTNPDRNQCPVGGLNVLVLPSLLVIPSFLRRHDRSQAGDDAEHRHDDEEYYWHDIHVISSLNRTAGVAFRCASNLQNGFKITRTILQSTETAACSKRRWTWIGSRIIWNRVICRMFHVPLWRPETSDLCPPRSGSRLP